MKKILLINFINYIWVNSNLIHETVSTKSIAFKPSAVDATQFESSS